MSVSKYRQKILAEVRQHRSELDDETRAALDLAQSKDQIEQLIGVINENGSSSEQKSSAINKLNAISFFSPVLATKTPELVNALRGQIESPNEELRRRAIGTLAAMKDDVVQERLLEEITSDKPEAERLVPTASALAMLGRDEKAVPTTVLRKIMMAPPSEASQIEAIRQMPSDPDASADLIALMKDENVPLAAREMIPGMVSEADPVAFLNAAEDMLNTSGAEGELATWLVKGISKISAPEATDAVVSARNVVAKLRANSPGSFQAAAGALLDNNDASEN